MYPELADLGDLDNALVTIRFARRRARGHARVADLAVRPRHSLRGGGNEGSVFVRGVDGSLLTARTARAFRRTIASASPMPTAELTAFVAACRGEPRRGAGLEDDRHAVAIGIAARASAVAGGPLEVGPDWPWP